MMKGLIFALLLTQAFAAEKVVGQLYINTFMGHIHKNPAKLSSSLTTVQCAHAVKVLENDKINVPAGWVFVQAGDDKGYVAAEQLSSTRPECFQEKYPRFYGALNLDLTDMYFWGRLYDQYSTGKSKVK